MGIGGLNERSRKADKGDIGIMGVDGIDKADIFDEYFDDDKPKVTNFEKIKAMDIDEMVEFFIKHKLSCRSVIRDNTAPCPLSSDICTPEKCYKQWLESEARE